jgi:uncharacterized membrane protein (UPF0136 family)
MSETEDSLQQLCKEVEVTTTVHGAASLLLQTSLGYYRDIQKQARKSFLFAVLAAVVGVVFFGYAVLHDMPTATPANYIGNNSVSLIAGALMEVVAAVNFYLYAEVIRQSSGFHVALERTHRLLIANALCKDLNTRKDEMRMELIRLIAKAPMLTLDVINWGARQDGSAASGDSDAADDAEAASAEVKENTPARKQPRRPRPTSS